MAQQERKTTGNEVWHLFSGKYDYTDKEAILANQSKGRGETLSIRLEQTGQALRKKKERRSSYQDRQ